MKNLILFRALIFTGILGLCSCDSEETQAPDRIQLVDPNPVDANDPTTVNIDFTNWKVTLPVDINNDGRPDEYQPNQLKDGAYRSLNALQGWMYDSDDQSGIIFKTTFVPDGATTTNSAFPRTELRELINPSNSRDNWDIASGGVLKMRMNVESSTPNGGTGSLNLDRFIVAQIHGIIKPSDVQRMNLSSDAAPPLLKMQWRDGNLVAYKKNLRDESMSGDDIITKDDRVWGDISHNFGFVGYEPFDLEIRASAGRLDVTVNNVTHVFQDVSLSKWPFDSYFKAGVYMQSTSPQSEAVVKMYSLEVTH